MTLLILMLIVSLAAGALFAYMAVWLTTQKGNTLADIANSPKLADAPAIKADILGKVSLASNYPIVALYIVSAVIPLATIAYLLYLLFPAANAGGLVTLSGNLSPLPTDGSPVCITTQETQVDPSGVFTIALPYSDTPEHVVFTGKDYFPETMMVTFDKTSMSAHVKITSIADSKPYDVKLSPPSLVVDLPSPVPLAVIPK